MDLLAYLASIERRADAVIDNAAALKAEVGQVRTLYRSQLEQWNGIMRDTTRPCPPSELPDSRLGSALAKVRDFLRPAPGRPVDPEFDRVVEAYGLENARGSADLLVGAGLAVDAVWRSLRKTCPRPAAPWAERAE